LLRRRTLAAAALAAAGCVAPLPPSTRGPQPSARGPEGERIVRIALARGAARIALSGTGEWRIVDGGAETTLVRAAAREVLAVERSGWQLRTVGSDGTPAVTRPAPLIVRPAGDGSQIVVDGRRYRGAVALYSGDSGLVVVNQVGVEEYLRGVVPMEIGKRSPDEHAAVEAQAIAARSYAYVHSGGSLTRAFDMLASTQDQVYGGADAETSVGDAAVAATHGLVLTYAGRVVNAPYHSTCGGTTAAVSEVWQRTSDEPYLVPVSDRIPGTDRYYCDASPRFRWIRSFDRAALASALDRYLHTYVAVPGGRVGRARAACGRSRSPRIAGGSRSAGTTSVTCCAFPVARS
jgi:stage II sporulation protein D